VVAATMAGCSAGRAASAATDRSLPKTPVGQQLAFVIDLFNGRIAPGAYAGHFAPSFLDAVPPDRLADQIAHTVFQAPWKFDHFDAAPGPDNAVAILKSRVADTAVVAVHLSPATHFITGLSFRPDPAGGPAVASPALAARAGSLAVDMTRGDFGAVRAAFDVPLKNAVSEDKVHQGWTNATRSLGAYRSTGTPILKSVVPGFATYFVPLTFEKGGVEVEVAFEGAGTVAAFFVRPPGFHNVG
jgi:hypothetical protein